ncbi:hypothetical protein B0H14DRAFT_2622371 [Mycena olivaceomarginata]|nr:hypothetical protein B0H14DRAFT_2622371 [Mycena olivaceomarginata]
MSAGYFNLFFGMAAVYSSRGVHWVPNISLPIPRCTGIGLLQFLLWRDEFGLSLMPSYSTTTLTTTTDTQGFNAPYFELRLNNRKGWQRKISKAQKEADLRSGKYKICSQPDLPACDAHHWLPLWRKYLQEVIYRRPLGPEDYIFPAIGANGIVQVGEHVSHDDVQKWIKEFTAGAKLPQANGTFSTHCYRRGGAQYRFMFAPVGRRWTLRQVRWWGGWAEGENRDTLIKYLLDELGTYEDDYSGLLLPNQPDMDESFLGEGSSLATATTGQLNLFHQSLSADMRAVTGTLSALVETFAKISKEINLGDDSMKHPVRSHSPAPAPFFIGFHEPTAGAVVAAIQPGNLLATPHLVIPDIPVTLPDGTRSPRHESWEYVVKHWVDGDPAHGLEKPLRDWPKEWLAGSNKPKFAMKYHDRRVITYRIGRVAFTVTCPSTRRAWIEVGVDFGRLWQGVVFGPPPYPPLLPRVRTLIATASFKPIARHREATEPRVILVLRLSPHSYRLRITKFKAPAPRIQPQRRRPDYPSTLAAAPEDGDGGWGRTCPKRSCAASIVSIGAFIYPGFVAAGKEIEQPFGALHPSLCWLRRERLVDLNMFCQVIITPDIKSLHSALSLNAYLGPEEPELIRHRSMTVTEATAHNEFKDISNKEVGSP